MKRTESFVKGKEQRKEDPLQVRVCRFQRKDSTSSPISIQSSSMASGMNRLGFSIMKVLQYMILEMYG